MNSNIAISLKNVSKYYKLYDDPTYRLKEALSLTKKEFHQKFYATKNFSLDIKKGEILGIVGKNGSGKSTLLKLITSVLSPDEGSIEINGKISALLELGSGFNPEFTGLQNISFYGTILGFTKKEMDEKIDDIIAFADIGTFISQPLKTYSSGMKSRLAFSVAVHIEPEILILDEVLSVGDIHFKRKAYNKMQTFFESGKTIIYVSHSAGEVNRLCTRAIMLHDGEILMDGEPKEVTKYYEKYLFAKDENKQNIVNEIKNYSKDITTIDEKNNKHVKAFTKNKSLLKAYYIPNFISKSKIEYDDTDIEINDVQLKTLNGEKVNVLITNEEYIFSYKLLFKKKYKNIYLGMQVMTEKGVLISGSAFQESTSEIKVEETLEIQWKFNCAMNCGHYFFNIAITDSEKNYINKLVDAYMIKVLSNYELENGMVYLQQGKPKIIRNKIQEHI